jgi:sugar lactone lactonase YvrE
VYLYAAGSLGNGSHAASLLKISASGINTDNDGLGYATTDANGSFTITGDWTCSSATDQVYLLALGGNPGLTTGTNNTALALMSGLGTCSAVASNYPAMVVNEVTTAASVWSLQQFMVSGVRVGRSTTNLIGLSNAFSQIGNLVNLQTGQALAKTPAGNGISPISKLNTLANLLSLCAASVGASSIPCSSLISTAAVTGTPSSIDTIGIALQIATHPAANSPSIFALAASGAPFQPQLSSAPNDWILPLSFTGGGLNGPTSLQVDGSGNPWVANYSGAASVFSPMGVPLASNGYYGMGLRENFGMAIDVKGNIWLANEESSGGVNGNLGSVTVINANGQTVSGNTGYAAGGIYYPSAITADPNGNMWVVNYGNSTVTLLSSTGVPISGAGGWGSSALQFPVALAVDSLHNAWVANQSGSTISKVTSTGITSVIRGCCNGASGIATDQSDTLWVANYYGDSVSEVDNSGRVILNQINGGGLLHPLGIAVDGAGSIWVGNYRGGTISELSHPTATAPSVLISPPTGFGTDASMIEPYGIALDASGNVWVSSYGTNSITQFIGIASPIHTPFAGSPIAP